MSSRQGSSITWSSYNYPTLINDTATGESVSFFYGPDRRAWSEQTQTPSGTETAYHIGGLLDIIASGGVTDYRHYIYIGGRPVAIDSRKSSGANAVYYLLTDQQGSVSAITNSTGGVVVGESFSAYGNRRNPGAWSGAPSSSDLNTIAGITRHGYTFQSALASQMGLNNMVGRVQDAITGRFLSADPQIPDPTDPQSYNRYSYVRNNPLTYTDPTGFADESHQTERENQLEYFGSSGGSSGSAGGGSGPVVIQASRLDPMEPWSSYGLINAYGQVTKPDGSWEGGTAAAQEGVTSRTYEERAANGLLLNARGICLSTAAKYATDSAVTQCCAGPADGAHCTTDSDWIRLQQHHMAVWWIWRGGRNRRRHGTWGCCWLCGRRE